MSSRVVDGVVVLSLSGSFYGDKETDDFQTLVLEAASQPRCRIVVDMSSVQAVNSTWLGVLMRAYATARKQEGELKLVGLNKRTRDLFIMTKLMMVIDSHESTEEAIRAFSAT